MSYTPSDTIKDPEVYRELQEIARTLEDVITLRVTAITPDKPREGNVRIANGTTWNPLGDGIKRPVWFNGTTGLWQAF